MMIKNSADIPRDCTECKKYKTCNNAHYGSLHCKPEKK